MPAVANEPQETAANSPTQPPAKAAAPASAQPAAAASSPALEPDVKYTKAQWAERARTVFRVSPHALAGALHDRPDGEPIGEGDVRSALDQFSVVEGTS